MYVLAALDVSLPCSPPPSRSANRSSSCSASTFDDNFLLTYLVADKSVSSLQLFPLLGTRAPLRPRSTLLVGRMPF